MAVKTKNEFDGVRIFLVDDEDMLAWSIEKEFRGAGAEVLRVSTLSEALQEYERFQPDLNIIDLSLPDGNGLELLKKWKHDRPDLPSILITSHPAVDSAITALRSGATDYLKKPFDMSALVMAARRAVELASLREKVRRQQGTLKSHTDVTMIGSSRALENVKADLRRIAASFADTILIRGESGSGKELAARALHLWSGAAKKPFVEINCASIPDNLLESELFGYEKGAFTDASERKPGLFEIARQGTIFLDEIGEMPPKLQAKLLRVLEYRRFKRLGGVRDIEFSARIVAATNRNLIRDVQDGKFRADLFYRLNVIDVELPPLRDRISDVPELAAFFLDEIARKAGQPAPGLSRGAVEAMKGHNWPGNIRELRNVLMKALVLHSPRELLKEHLQFSRLEESMAAPVARVPAMAGNDHTPVTAAAAHHNDHAFALPPEGISLDGVEKELIMQALERSGHNQTKAARLLGVSRHTFRYRLEKHGFQKAVP